MNKKLNIRIEKTNPENVPILFSLIKELAVYENLIDQVVTNEEAIAKTLFGEKSFAEARLAFLDEEPAGMVIFFHNYSTFLGKPGLYIEDLYVKEKYRGLGIGKALLKKCAEIAIERDCGRMEWSVLTWNPARKFYERMGASPLKEWIVYRLDRDKLNQLF